MRRDPPNEPAVTEPAGVDIRCRRCGCDLAGLLPSHNCPECGTSVASSIPVGARVWRQDAVRIETDLRCRRCESALRGLRADGVCPGCGLRVEESQGYTAAAAVGEDDRVQRDIPCRHCGYNLRGLQRECACPECGTAVERSIRGDLLCFADPAWVHHVSRGAGWVRAGLVLCAAVFLTITAEGFTFPALLRSGYSDLFTYVALAEAAAGGMLILVGAWYGTAPDPAAVSRRSSAPRRWRVRGGLLAGLCAIALTVALALLPVQPKHLEIALEALQLTLVVAGIVGIATYFGHLADLAARVPDRRLENRGRNISAVIEFLAVTIWLVWACTQAADLFVRGDGWRVLSVLYPAGACVGAVAGLGLFITMIFALIFQSDMRRALRAQAEQAAKNWAAHPRQRGV